MKLSPPQVQALSRRIDQIVKDDDMDPYEANAELDDIINRLAVSLKIIQRQRMSIVR